MTDRAHGSSNGGEDKKHFYHISGGEMIDKKNLVEDDDYSIDFEGPEKVLEIWFANPDRYEDISPMPSPMPSPSPKSEYYSNGINFHGASHDNASFGSSTSSLFPRPASPASHSLSRSSTTTPIAGNSTSTAQPTGPIKGKKWLRAVGKADWEEMLDLVHCKVLSSIGNDYADAYLLSESSMFVYPLKVVLKTCGTTTLLHAIPKLLEIAKSVGLTQVENVFFSRQNFFWPEKQLFPHRTFTDECKALDGYFENGAAYTVGRINENHYHFYNAECYKSVQALSMEESDATLELLMTGLDPEVMKECFYHKDGVSVEEVTRKSGIAGFFPGALIDQFVFEPFGYSMNGLIDDAYFTIHITPQPECSFASFETNALKKNYTKLVLRVLAAFKPSRFILAHVANSCSVKYIRNIKQPRFGFDCKEIKKLGMIIQDDIYCHFDHYDLFFMQFRCPTEEDGLTDDSFSDSASTSGTSTATAASSSSSSSSSSSNRLFLLPPVEKANGTSSTSIGAGRLGVEAIISIDKEPSSSASSVSVSSPKVLSPLPISPSRAVGRRRKSSISHGTSRDILKKPKL